MIRCFISVLLSILRCLSNFMVIAKGYVALLFAITYVINIMYYILINKFDISYQITLCVIQDAIIAICISYFYEPFWLIVAGPVLFFYQFFSLLSIRTTDRYITLNHCAFIAIPTIILLKKWILPFIVCVVHTAIETLTTYIPSDFYLISNKRIKHSLDWNYIIYYFYKCMLYILNNTKYGHYIIYYIYGLLVWNIFNIIYIKLMLISICNIDEYAINFIRRCYLSLYRTIVTTSEDWDYSLIFNKSIIGFINYLYSNLNIFSFGGIIILFYTDFYSKIIPCAILHPIVDTVSTYIISRFFEGLGYIIKPIFKIFGWNLNIEEWIVIAFYIAPIGVIAMWCFFFTQEKDHKQNDSKSVLIGFFRVQRNTALCNHTKKLLLDKIDIEEINLLLFLKVLSLSFSF